MKQKEFRIFATVCISALILLSLFQVFTLKPSVGMYLFVAVQIAGGVCALFYMFKGCTKQAAKPYFVWTVAFMAMQAMGVVSTVLFGTQVPCVVLECLALAATVVMAFVKNLGRAATTVLGWFVAVVNYASFLIYILAHKESGNPEVFMALATFTDMILYSVVYLSCIKGKYLDKAERGTD